MHDLRLALRGCRRRPGFAAVVVVTLGLGIGATTTIFSLVHGVLLRPFPYPDDERLVRVQTMTGAGADNLREASIYDVRDWREQNRSLSNLAAYWSFHNTLSGDGAAQSVLMTFASSELFSVLGVAPALGRVFTPEEDRIGGAVNQVILSHGLWQARFGASPDVIGRTVRLRGDAYTVIGVMPPGFRFPQRSDVWVPLMSRYASYPTPWWTDRTVRIHSVVGRLRPGVDVRAAQRDLEAIAARLAHDHPASNAGVGLRVRTLRDVEVGAFRPYLVLLSATVALVLLMACVNVANLMLVRAMAREGELALRSALGASRGRLMQQVIVESGLLGALGGLLGISLAHLGLRALLRLIPVELPFWMRIDVDGRVLAFAAAISIGTGIVCGIVPAWSASRRDLADALRPSGRIAGGRFQSRFRQGFVLAQVAFSLMLLAGASLLGRSFVHLTSVETGFEAQGLLSAYVGHFLPNRSYDDMIQAHSTDFRRILERLRELPGVTAAAGASDVPYYERPVDRSLTLVATRGQSQAEQRDNLAVVFADVTPGYFQAMQMPIVEGRDFDERDDRSTPYVAVVSRRLAARLWPGRPAVGQEVRLGEEGPESPWHRVIGVVGDTRWQATEGTSGGEVYYSYKQWPTPKLHLLVRTAGDPNALVPDLRRIVREVNAENAITYAQPLAGLMDDALWQPRLWALVLASFAGLGLILVSLGVYGVLSQTVTDRLREVAIRLALGARTHEVVTLLVGGGMRLVLAGIVIGLSASLAAGRWLAGLLYGVTAADPATLAMVSLILFAVGVTGAVIPARRALRVDPATTLRGD